MEALACAVTIPLVRSPGTVRHGKDGTIMVDGILPVQKARAITLDTRQTEVPLDALCSSQPSDETVVQV